MGALTNQSLNQKFQGEDMHLANEKIIYLELFKKPQNSKMLHISTGIPREDITRYKRHLENRNLLWVMKYDYCPFTGRLVQFLTTNIETYRDWQKQSENILK